MTDPDRASPDRAPNALAPPPRTPPPVQWIQALGIVALVAIVALRVVGEVPVPREVYAILGAAIVGLGPEQVERIVLRRREPTDD